MSESKSQLTAKSLVIGRWNCHAYHPIYREEKQGFHIMSHYFMEIPVIVMLMAIVLDPYFF